MQKKLFTNIDTTFLFTTGVLLFFGVLVFLSASLSLISTDPIKFKSILFNQLVLGLLGGIVVLWITMQINYKKIAPWGIMIGLLGIIVTALVFVPGIGFSHGGATRWLNLGPLSFQPVELLKYCTIVMYSSWLAVYYKKIESIKYGLIPFLAIMGIVGTVLLLQPDTDNFMIIAITCFVLYIIAGAKKRDIAIIIGIGIIAIAGLIITRPYILARVKVFLDPGRDPLGSSYQVEQQLIAIGSGQVTGRGFGQGIQKFKYLPEPLGDSIYAVASEEFGFVGSVALIAVYIAFVLRGAILAIRVENMFGKFTMIGIILLITGQSFLHIASSIAVFPLSGLPLVFISHGGTALLLSLGAIGLVFNISREAIEE